MKTNLGRDTRLAEIAALAATNAAELDQGFNKAEEAARTAWADAANRDSNGRVVPLRNGHLLRDIAIGCVLCVLVLGAATLGMLWLVVTLFSGTAAY